MSTNLCHENNFGTNLWTIIVQVAVPRWLSDPEALHPSVSLSLTRYQEGFIISQLVAIRGPRFLGDFGSYRYSSIISPQRTNSYYSVVYYQSTGSYYSSED